MMIYSSKEAVCAASSAFISSHKGTEPLQSAIMITVTNTPNLARVCISGDFYDLGQLVEAFHNITIDEFTKNKKEIPYIDMSTRVLGLCYDIRHAAQGDRNWETKENGLPHILKQSETHQFSKTNLYYSCNYYYPEMIYIMLALDELIELRIYQITKAKYPMRELLFPQVTWDESIAVIRNFQAAFQKNMSSFLSPASMTRWLNLMENNDGVSNLVSPFLDRWNIKYLNWTREQREKKILTFTKSICQCYRDKDYINIMQSVFEAAEAYGCSPSELSLKGMEYPEEIDW